jgi:hypothetical protein
MNKICQDVYTHMNIGRMMKDTQSSVDTGYFNGSGVGDRNGHAYLHTFEL